MFDGMPEQFYQFLAAAASSATTTTTHVAATLPLSFSLHHDAASNTFPIQHPPFDASFLLNHNHHQHDTLPPPTVQLQPLHEETSINVPWSNEEVLALLKIKSNLDNTWFPPHDFTWENVSRKLAEIGFKRSAEKCKEKFEEETRSFHNTSNNVINSSNNKNISQNYRLFGELEELYSINNNNVDDCSHHNGIHDDHPHHESPPTHDLDDGNQSSDAHDDLDDGNHDASLESNENVAQEKLMANEENHDDDGDDQQSLDGDSEKTAEETTKKVVVRKRKRSSQEKKFEMFKGFCEKIVNKMMAQQEELHCKILQDMVKRDEEKIAREEAWKRQELERISKEIQVRAHEQIIVGDRQAKILEFLKKFSPSHGIDTRSFRETLENFMIKVPKTHFSTNSSLLCQDSLSGSQPTSSCSTYDHIQNQNSSSLIINDQSCPNIPISSSTENLASQSSNSISKSNLAQPITLSPLNQTLQNPNHHVSQNESLVSPLSTHKSFEADHTSTDAKEQVSKSSVGNVVKGDTGRRWPRDEVLALINIRCNHFSNNGDQHDKDSFSKGPLWEKISQKMLELGYKRSAKRCKEKWENINKYFRKTKDLNKKRSVDSRTCPYFYQLSHLYSQGAIHGSSDRPTNCSPGNQPMESPGAQGGSNNASNVATAAVHAATQLNEGTQVVQVPGFDFEF